MNKGTAATASWTLTPNEWESSFFDRKLGTLHAPSDSHDRSHHQTVNDVGALVAVAMTDGIDLLECHLPVSRFTDAAALEQNGFTLVDSKVRFLSEWSTDDIPPTEPTIGRIRSYHASDRERIIELTHENFTYNDQLVSRFKNREFFSENETRRWFEAWITSTAIEGDAATAIFEVDGYVAGYYTYAVRGEIDGLPQVQGILTAVEPEYRGANAQLAMQAYLYAELGFDRWVLDNATHLTNLPVIRNHIRSKKRLEEVNLVFYRSIASREV